MAMPGPIKPSHRGLLHRKMGVPQGQKISISALMHEKAKAKRTHNAALMKQTTYAINARHWGH